MLKGGRRRAEGRVVQVNRPEPPRGIPGVLDGDGPAAVLPRWRSDRENTGPAAVEQGGHDCPFAAQESGGPVERVSFPDPAEVDFEPGSQVAYSAPIAVKGDVAGTG